MAPMTRSTAVVPRPNPLLQKPREGGWHFLGADMASERVSEEPASSFDEAELASRLHVEDYDRPPLQSPRDYDADVHPLRETADRVGSEVENFAKALDEFNPLRARSDDEKHDMTITLLKKYSDLAQQTLESLRDQHDSKRRKQEGSRWRKNFRGLAIAQDEDEMDLEETDIKHFPEPKTTLEDLERWVEETQTWDLLSRLVDIQYSSSRSNRTSPAQDVPIHRYSSENEVWQDFLESDGLALERKAVLEWLKHTADTTREEINVLVEDLQKNAERGDIITHGWLHTKMALKNRKRIHVWPHPMDPSSPEVQRVNWNSDRTEPLVTHLDPDAMTRQGRKLEAQDEFFERAIWLGCYEMLRRGKSSAEIREWCMERTEVWRAVSMSRLPDEKPENEDEDCNPASSALWRRICYALARKGGGDEYERAVYGILSGDISSVEPACQSWDDFVFAHYNALLRTQFDHHLRQLYPSRYLSASNSTFGIFDAVQFHGDAETAGRRLIDTLKIDSRTAEEASRPMKMLQGVMISNLFSHFIYQQGLALSKFGNLDDPSHKLYPAMAQDPEDEHINNYITFEDYDSLRVVTHVLLALTNLGVDMGGPAKQMAVENVIVSYIWFLKQAAKEELIPLYCSQLSGTRRYATLCRTLIDVTDPEEQRLQIRLMRELGLDVQTFVKYQSRYLLVDYPDTIEGYPAAGNFHLLEEAPASKQGLMVRSDFFGEDNIDKVDELLIRSLEWYLHVDGLWSETFYYGTLLYLRFFKQMRLSAARALASRVTSSDICKMKTFAILKHSCDFQDLEHGSEVEDRTEILDWEPEKTRLLKKHMLTEAKSFRELEALVESLDNMETIAGMGEILQEKSEQNWQKGWRQQLARAVSPTKQSVQPLLKGWLLTSQREEQQEELQSLREAYLPETILAYIKTLHFAGKLLSRDLLTECMDLSALIAAEDSDLLDLFVNTGRMQELVDAFALASKELLILTSQKQGSGSRSKKLRAKGWTPELWTVKP